MVKVEMKVDETRKIRTFVFECSKAEDHETLDAIRVAIFGEHEKRGGYKDSNTLVVEVKDE